MYTTLKKTWIQYDRSNVNFKEGKLYPYIRFQISQKENKK